MSLEGNFRREMQALDDALASGSIDRAEYNSLVRELEIDAAEQEGQR